MSTETAYKRDYKNKSMLDEYKKLKHPISILDAKLAVMQSLIYGKPRAKKGNP